MQAPGALLTIYHFKTGGPQKVDHAEAAPAEIDHRFSSR
jgi:hypothetical protein